MIYILEFSAFVGNPDNPRGRARYYLGWCRDDRLGTRLRQHAKGRGAAITRAAIENGITFKVALLIPHGTRKDERRLKKWKNHRRVIAVYMRRRDHWWKDYIPPEFVPS
ncbi:hypothetical protein LCGC14_1130170 [marine sediment metagenome]|uniref:GIY-YIG domain-containing protein n=1 Tax=marine sediment metagenome TaxID=412755 RepID=A0A0F9Q727_9ZZZZ